MTVRLTDNEISKLVRQRRIISCELWRCSVCGLRQHASPITIHRLYPHKRERCPNGCVLDDEVLVTAIVGTHWHAADGTGPVSQYAVT